jgi:hypothetical protein
VKFAPNAVKKSFILAPCHFEITSTLSGRDRGDVPTVLPLIAQSGQQEFAGFEQSVSDQKDRS